VALDAVPDEGCGHRGAFAFVSEDEAEVVIGTHGSDGHGLLDGGHEASSCRRLRMPRMSQI
jgi:hypothetical protein